MDLSIIIPSRNEMFLGITIENILKNIRGETDIIAVLDGYTTEIPKIPVDPRVKTIYHGISIGQRAACNEAARYSKAKYIMKLDGHCSVDEGIDVKMLAKIQPDWTMIPIMYNLHAFDWVCKCGHRLYQGPTPEKCEKCGGKMEREIIWYAKRSPESTAYRFDNTLHFQYWGEYKKRPEYKQQLKETGITETMSIQGSCFMISKERWFDLNICDEGHGSWGQQGTEVACCSWLSGGKVKVNHSTWYAHMFRTQGGDFGFPYPNPGITSARQYSRNLWINGKYKKAIYPLSWLLEKFSPVPDWDTSKGIVYYTDNTIDPVILKACQDQITKANDKKYRIVTVSLKRTEFGDYITLNLERSPLTMFKQILKGLKTQETDVVFLCEHDVLYHPSHFDFVPPRKDTFYYNSNVWFLRATDGHCLHYEANQLSGLCAYREPLIKHFEERIKLIEKEGFTRRMGFEPMTHHRIKWQNQYGCESWKSPYPNVDVKHSGNLIRARWKKEEFRNQKFTQGWTESEGWQIPGWKNLKEVLNDN